MAYRRIVRWAVDEAGNVIGGTGYEGRIYLANTLTLATIYLDSAGGTTVANPHSPNAGTQTSSTANMLTTDDTITVISSTGFAVGDLVPIDGSAGRFYGVIKQIVDGTHIKFTQTLAAMGGAATMNSGALVGGPEMTGHFQCFVQDTSDYDFTLKNLATSKEGPPEGVATLSTAGTLAFQEEGVSTGAARPTVNFISPFITAADNAGQNRVDVTGPTAGVAPTTSAVGDAAAEGSNNTIARSDHKHGREAFGNVAALVYAAANGSATTISRSDHNHGVTLTTASAQLGSNVTMTNANTWYDGPSVSLAAGTWIVICVLTCTPSTGVSNAAGKATGRLWDGTTTYASTEGNNYIGASGTAGPTPLPMVAIVTPGSTTSYKGSAAATQGGSTLHAAAPDNGVGNNASTIVAVRLA